MENLEADRKKIQDFTLASSELTRVLLQVFGSAGHGKSSLINSFKYALGGGLFDTPAKVASGQLHQGGLTTHRNSYKLTDTITAVDNRGFGKMDNYETREIYAQLANILPLDQKVNWVKSFDETLDSIIGTDMNYKDLIVPLYVYSVEHRLEQERNEEIKTFLKTAQTMTGILPIIILTRKNSGNLEEIKKQFENMGMENILPVENYTPEDHEKTLAKDAQFLNILLKALEIVKFRMNCAQNPKRDHDQRIKMLIKMAKDAEVDKVRNEAREEFTNKQYENKPADKKCRIL